MLRATVFFSICLGAACGAPTTPTTPTTPTPPTTPEATQRAEPEDPGASFEAPTGMRTYYVVLLRRGPAWTAEPSPEAEALGRGHMAHIGAMAKAGHLITAGPFLGQTDKDDYAGIYVFDVKSLSEVKALTARDPAVAAGRFAPEYLIWMGAAGLRVNAMATDPTQPSSAKKNPCASADHRAFDFWVGDWTVTNPKGVVVGTNRIERDHRGCALIESWTSARGGTGSSTNYWDRERGKWVQLWVDGTGGVIHLVGGLDGDAMALAGSYVQASGAKSQLRGRWTPQPDGAVRQLFEESKDGGKTWAVWFDGIYRRRDGSP